MKYIISTLGCKVNQYETQAMESLLRLKGHEPCGKDERADAVIVNSCAVTAESARPSAALEMKTPAALWRYAAATLR